MTKITKGATIYDSISSDPLEGTLAAGLMPGEGTYFCIACGSQLSLHETDRLPECPRCGAGRFRRDSIFESRQEHSGTTTEIEIPIADDPPAWLAEAREQLLNPGYHLAMLDDQDSIETFAIERGWTRVGRSANADIRLDDPSVSRRHALIVAEPGRDLRVLDDRSLNGVYVNGEPTDWGVLRDGDTLTVGRFALHVLKA
ncbi:MAG: FHA domain-containing protein [Solirubrobacterales bacterium]